LFRSWKSRRFDLLGSRVLLARGWERCQGGRPGFPLSWITVARQRRTSGLPGHRLRHFACPSEGL